MLETNSKSSKVKLYSAIYYVSSLFLPSILLFNLYNQNRVENHLIFEHVLVLAGIFAFLGLLTFLFFRFATASLESAFLLLMLFWLCFWLFESFHGFVASFIPSLRRYIVFIIIGICILATTFLFRWFKPPFHKISPALITLAICSILLSIFNIIPGVYNEIALRHNSRLVDSMGSNLIKTEFVVDGSLPSPNILWIHVDGMMSLETVERHWGLDLVAFRDELAERGFLIYEDAILHAGFTDAALPALLSPTFFDIFWSEYLDEAKGSLRRDASSKMSRALTNEGLTYTDDVFPNFELLNAFIAKDYLMIIEHTIGVRLAWAQDERMSTEQSYLFGRWHRDIFMDLPELLRLATPLNIDYFSTVISSELSYFDTEEHSTFTWAALYHTHVYGWSPGLYETVDYTAVHLYPAAYKRITERILYVVDSVLETDPNTVIVLQSDHGFHNAYTQQFMLDEGYSIEQVLELIHSVFSAVRIPPQYGGLEAPLAPLNISRELVNRFVGENYELLP